ncbi:bifunctional serine/threonine-protein kinase/ABC transporter substrate-binding protein [Spirillospora sp. NPDC127200]
MADPLLADDPARVGDYELLGRLGDGGQGSVYLGRGPEGREVAVKLLHARLSRDAQARSRFVRELEVAERVSGFCTAQVLDADIDGDRPYIVSEFVDGPSLAELVRDQGPLDAPALLRLAIGTATALAAIHRAGIVHRDFKPPNVLIGQGGPRVIDFGIARALDSAVVTVTSQVVGTPSYMAPEQIAGGAVGPAADVFAWGGTMVFAATGRTPFGGDSIPAVLHRVLNAEADVSALPARLGELVAACLHKDPARRPASSDLLLRLLSLVGARETGGDPLERGATLVDSDLTEVLLAPPPTVPAAPRQRPRKPLVLGGAALAMALTAAVPAAVIALQGAGGGSAEAGAEGTVTIGFLGALSGMGSEVVAPAHQGAKLAVERYNAGRPRIRAVLQSFDTQGTQPGARQAARRAVDAKAVAVVGPVLTKETDGAAPVLEQARVPSVSPAASGTLFAQKGWKYWHSMVPNAEEATDALAAKVADDADDLGTVVVLDDLKPWTGARNTANVYANRLETEKAKVHRYTLPDASFGPRPDHAEVIAELRRLNAATVFYGGLYDVSGPLIAQARKAGITARFHLADGSLSTELTKAAGTAADGTLIACSCLLPEEGGGDLPRSFRDFAEDYAERTGEQPRTYAAEGYDAAWSVLHALKKGKRTGDAVNAHLGEMREPGVTQQLRFSMKGELTDSRTYLYRVEGGRIAYDGEA